MIPPALRDAIKSSPGGPTIHRLYRHAKARRAALRLRRFLVSARFCDSGQAAAIARDWRAVSEHTQLSQAGILNLETLARYVVANRLHGAFVECGTWRGGALSFWARSFLRNGGDPASNPLFGFDSFQGMPDITPEDGTWAAEMLHGRSLEQLAEDEKNGALKPNRMNEASEKSCRAILAESGFPPQHAHIVKGWFQDTLPQWRERIGPIAVLRLDGDWYESTKTCLENLFDQVLPGGAIVVDDYGYFVGCQKAVNEFMARRSQPMELVFVDDCIRYFLKRS